MNELKMIESELVPIYKTNTGEKVVNGRELWIVLKSKRDFSTWIKSRLLDCDATENIDFIRFHKKVEANNATMIEYIIKLDTAKEMAMLERNEIGKQVRRYFIKIENKYKGQLVQSQPASSLDVSALQAINEAVRIILPTVEAMGIDPVHKSYLFVK